MTRINKYFIPLIFLTLFSCQNKDQNPYDLINDIKTDFKIQYLSISADSLTFDDESAKQEFIQNCKEFIAEKDLTNLLNENTKPFKWDKNKLKGIALISFDSVLKINMATGKQNNLYYISAPIIDDKGENAIMRIFQQLPTNVQVTYGGVCVHLFKRSSNKWKEMTRENCRNF